MTNKSTYTYGTLKKSIYKVLEEYSLNGNRVSVTSGIAADIEMRFTAVLNMCARRIALSLPRLIKNTAVVFEKKDGIISAVLPEDFSEVVRIFICGKGAVSAYELDKSGENMICNAAKEGDTANIEYIAAVNIFSSDTPENEPVLLPDVSSDALVYLTAAELCPAEHTELYSKLMASYRSIALNCYNAEKGSRKRNSFYVSGRKKLNVGY